MPHSVLIGALQFSRKALTSHGLKLVVRTLHYESGEAVNAQMAELVDALVSNTSDSNIVPVRSRLWAQSSNDVRAYQNHWREAVGH